MADKANDTAEKAPKDPDNVWVSAGKKDETKVYIATPFNYRSAQAAIKEAGATFKGDSWEMDKDAFKAAEDSIRSGAREDQGMTKEARKEREDALKANKPAKAEKAEPTAEEVAAKAAEREKAMKARDANQFPVIVGGDEKSITVGGVERAVVGRGAEFDVTDDNLASLKERFGDIGAIKSGDKVQFAKFEDPEKAAAKETEAASPTA